MYFVQLLCEVWFCWQVLTEPSHCRFPTVSFLSTTEVRSTESPLVNNLDKNSCLLTEEKLDKRGVSLEQYVHLILFHVTFIYGVVGRIK
jgi:hypothetical protein